VKEWRKMLGTNNFFYRLIQSRKRNLTDLWENILNVPRSQLKIYMFLLQNGNRMDKRKLIDELLKINYSDSKNYCKLAITRACKNHILVEDKAGFVSVVKPTYFIFKIVRGDILDNWKALVLLTLALTIVFATINPIITAFFGVVSLLIVVAWFLEDWRNTLKF